ncbi:aspartate aminotransferase family protein [Fodinisporobacter ferrooxydans]|uniref:Acetylornithine aminotransferase n=1 Tax=Fodinisporobacter ferrooxydans TaxID=2901836 RepID=A0ABY4CQ60_9BACL|nr:aspartate aminotransferase family protein [Alicyclobacillaceae bacterium MYW30-H2]
MTYEELFSASKQYLMPNYGRLPIAFAKGEGCFLYDLEGKKFLDFSSGIAVTSLGHAHPAVTAAISEQAGQLLHCSNLFHIPAQTKLAQLLVENSDFDQVLFCNSGAEANEGAIKLARRYAQLTYGPEKHEIITFHNAFHGRTFGALAATPTPKYQEGFAPLTPGFAHAVPGDMESVKALYTEATCAVMLEPIQGEGGVIPFAEEFLQELRAWCTEHQVLLIFDEVQTGCGRTGTLFAYQQFGVIPDIMTLAKGLGNGVPIGAVLAKAEISKVFTPGTHGTTFGGNPLVTAAGVATIEIVKEPAFLQHVQETGAYLQDALQALVQSYDWVKEIRGLGLIQGIVVEKPVANEIVKRCLDKGLIVLVAGANTVRILPPLIVEQQQLDQGVSVLKQAFQEQDQAIQSAATV